MAADDPVKVTVFYRRDAFDAIRRAAEAEGISVTDAINCAATVYAAMVEHKGQPFAYSGVTPDA